MSEQELKLQLARLLPEQLALCTSNTLVVRWRKGSFNLPREHVIDTEWLHVCWLIEQTFTNNECERYDRELSNLDCQFNKTGWMFNRSWQQRALAILKTKGLL